MISRKWAPKFDIGLKMIAWEQAPKDHGGRVEGGVGRFAKIKALKQDIITPKISYQLVVKEVTNTDWIGPSSAKTGTGLYSVNICIITLLIANYQQLYITEHDKLMSGPTLLSTTTPSNTSPPPVTLTLFRGGGGQKHMHSTFSSNYCSKAAINGYFNGL